MTDTTPIQAAARDALLPCPFCGEDNVKTFGPYGWYRQFGISHSCQSFYNGTSEMMRGFNSEADAITAWNRRALTHLTQTGEVEGLREAVSGIEYAHQVLTRVFEARGKLRDGVLASNVNMAAHRLAAARAALHPTKEEG